MCFSELLKLFLRADLGAYGTWSSIYAMVGGRWVWVCGGVWGCVCTMLACIRTKHSDMSWLPAFVCVLATCGKLQHIWPRAHQVITRNDSFYSTTQSHPTSLRLKVSLFSLLPKSIWRLRWDTTGKTETSGRKKELAYSDRLATSKSRWF